MDQQLIDTYVTVAVDRMKRVLRENSDDMTETPVLALILGTRDPFGSALEQPVIFAISEQCFPEPPTPREWARVLVRATEESGAVAIVIGTQYENSIMVEVRGRHELHHPNDDWEWTSDTDATSVHLLPCNRAN